MQTIIKKIENHLHDEQAFILIKYGNQRLAKRGENAGKYKFNASDVSERYGTVKNLIEALPNKGFKNGTIVSLARSKGRNNNILEELELNFNEENKNHTLMNNNTFYNPQQVTPPSVGLGFTAVRNDEYFNVKIKEQRYNDLQTMYEEQRAKIADLKSKIRQLVEENHALRVKLDTAETGFNLKLQQELLNKKSFLESPAMQAMLKTVSEAVKTVAPLYVGAMQGAGISPVALNVPVPPPPMPQYVNENVEPQNV